MSRTYVYRIVMEYMRSATVNAPNCSQHNECIFHFEATVKYHVIRQRGVFFLELFGQRKIGRVNVGPVAHSTSVREPKSNTNDGEGERAAAECSNGALQHNAMLVVGEGAITRPLLGDARCINVVAFGV